MQNESKMFHTGPHKTRNTVQNMAQLATSFRTTTPSTAMTGRMTTKEANSVHAHPDTSCKAHWDTVCMSTNPQFRFVNQVNH